MADSASNSQFRSAKSGRTRSNNSFFSVPGFFIGFCSRNSGDSNSVRSPTSPLDFSFFSGVSNPFGHKSSKSSPPTSHQKKWETSKVGLGNLLADETKPFSDPHSPERKNIIFGPQVKSYSTVRSNSLPKNFTMSTPCKAKTPSSQLSKSVSRDMTEEVSSEPSESPEFCSRNRTTPVGSSPLLIFGGSHTSNSSDVKRHSLPIAIESGHGNVDSLAARDIQLSEDYTCIISHGPNPKTIHIFCDSILECQTDDLSNSERTKNLQIELPQEAKLLEISAAYSSNELLSTHNYCKDNVEMGDDIHVYLSEQPFCSHSADAFSEEETEDNYDNFHNSSSNSSFHEDLFLLGMPVIR